MKLYKIRGGNEEELCAKKYNIGVGISIGNKWFSTKNILELIGWALKYTKEYVIIYVADSIHAYNIEVRNHKSPKKAKEMALKLGEKVLQEVKICVEKQFSVAELTKIHYAKWDKLLTLEFQEKIKFLYDKYENDIYFRNTILGLVESFTKNENRIFSHNEKVKLGNYIIEELPELLTCVPINELVSEAYAYPFDNKLTEFVDNIQSGIIFPEIRERIMNTRPKIFLEVRE